MDNLRFTDNYLYITALTMYTVMGSQEPIVPHPHLQNVQILLWITHSQTQSTE